MNKKKSAPPPIKVLYVIEGNGGGAITHTLSLAQGLNSEEVTASLVFFLDGPSVILAREMGLNYRLIPRKFDLDFTLAWKISRIIRDKRIDIIHTHTITGNFYARWAAFLTFLLNLRKPVLLTTVHSFVIDELKGETKISLRDWFRYRRDLFGHRFTKHFIVVSEKLKSRMTGIGIEPERITEISNGVKVPDIKENNQARTAVRQALKIADDETLIGIAGRLVPLKNHALFLKIAHKLSDDHEKLKFIIIGDGPLLSEMKKTSRKLELEERVIFTGWRNDVPKLMSALDIYVLTSVVEGLNISILEAMATGKPVVGTNTKGISDIVQHEKSGLLFELDDIAGFVSGLSRIICDKALSARLGVYGREIVRQQYSLESTIEKNQRVYQVIRGSEE